MSTSVPSLNRIGPSSRTAVAASEASAAAIVQLSEKGTGVASDRTHLALIRGLEGIALNPRNVLSPIRSVDRTAVEMTNLEAVGQ